MKRTTSQFEWLIRGYDSSKLIFEERVSGGLLSNQKVEALLRTLTAKAGLTFDEIVGAYVRKNYGEADTPPWQTDGEEE